MNVMERTKELIYNMWVDETFENFMNLPRMDGHFCYAGIMLPENADDQLIAFWSALEKRLVLAYENATGFKIIGEFKSTYLRKLSNEIRRDAMRRIAYFLTKNKGFIAGFYTTVHALMCWELRTEAGYDDLKTLAAYDPQVLEHKASELRREKTTGQGESNLLKGLFHTITAVPLSWLAPLKAKFRVCYDSRNPKEDRVLIQLVDQFFPRMAEIEPDSAAIYIGTVAYADSSKAPGLLLADLVCKELRNFVHELSEIITDRSEYILITPFPSKGMTIPVEIAGHILKWGEARKMSQETKSKLYEIRKSSVFSPLIPCLADHKLSCYAHFGEGRIVDFENCVFNDAVD